MLSITQWRCVIARVNLYLPDDLLADVNREVGSFGKRRSALVQQALREFLHQRSLMREEETRRRRMMEAVARSESVAERLGTWDPQQIIRSFRDSRRGTR